MSIHGGSVFSRLSKRSAIRDTSPLAVHLGNDNAMRRLLRDGVGINDIQKKYLSMCYSSRPAVRPNKDVAQGLQAGELVWNLTVSEKQETAIIAAILTTKEARRELRSIVFSAAQAGCASVRKRASLARRSAQGPRWGARELAMEKDPAGEVELFLALCRALPRLGALRRLELDGLHAAFERSGAGAARLARGLKGNANLKSLAIRHVRLTDPRALGSFSAALSAHPSLATLSLGYCGISGDQGARLAAAVIRAHAARRDGMVWSTGLRRPQGMVGNTAAAAPAKISTAGCLALDLSGNELGDAGVHTVARALQSDTWLVGLNLAHNGITDRGAALLTVCLQHNATLCALVLDGNAEIGHTAERRITAELEARSMMPEALLGEPEVVLTLASWGFSAHADSEGARPVETRSRGASEGAVSDISDDHFRGDGHGEGDGEAWPRARVRGTAPDPSAMTPLGQKEELIREFRRWAGHHPASDAVPAGCVSAQDRAHHVTRAGEYTRTVYAPHRGRTRAAEAFPAQGEQSVQADAAEAGRRCGRGNLARSWASPSTMSGGQNGEAGETRRRSMSSGPIGRAKPGAASGSRLAARASSRTRAADARAPWGVGASDGGARKRAQAWASTHLDMGELTVDDTVRRRRIRPRNRRKAGSEASSSAVHRLRIEKGRLGGSISNHFHGRRSSRKTGRRASTSRKNRRHAEAEANRGSAGAVSAADAATQRHDAWEPDVTRDVLGRDGYPELASRRRRRLASGVSSSVPHQPGANVMGAQDDGRTDRVVVMLETLQEAVVDVCKEMWRLEDRVDSREHRPGQEIGEDKDTSHPAAKKDVASGTEAHGAIGHNESRRYPPEPNSQDFLDDTDGRDEVAVQVEACLREMWHALPNIAPTHAATHNIDGVGDSTSRNAVISPIDAQDSDEPLVMKEVEVDLNEGEEEDVVVRLDPSLLLDKREEADGDDLGAVIDSVPLSQSDSQHGLGRVGRSPAEQPLVQKEHESSQSYASGPSDDRVSPMGESDSRDMERSSPAGIEQEAWRTQVFGDASGGEAGSPERAVISPREEQERDGGLEGVASTGLETFTPGHSPPRETFSGVDIEDNG